MSGKRVVIKGLWRVVMILLALNGCVLTGRSEPPETARDKLAARLDEAQRSQAAALALWDRIIFGEVVSCQETIPVPEMMALSPQDYVTYSVIQDPLNAAIQSLHNSADLWNIECNAARPAVPLSMAEAGRAQALAASDPLQQAAAQLAAWPN